MIPLASHNYSTSSLQREKKSPNINLKRKGVFETAFVTFGLVLYLWPVDKTEKFRSCLTCHQEQFGAFPIFKSFMERPLHIRF